MFRKMSTLVTLLLPLGAMAAPDSELSALRQQVVALQIDHAINLSQQQAKALLPLLESAKSEVEAYKASFAAAQPALTAALTQAVADLKASGQVSGATVQAVQQARPAPGTLHADLRSDWQQARQILTPDQIQALKATTLGIPPAASSTAQPGSRHGHFARRFRLMHAVLSDAFIALVQARAG